jgi:glycosyltransferase involved in cell wall biosynthesis
VRVLLILDSVGFGGAENLLVPLSRAGPAAGLRYEVATIAPVIPESARLLPALQEAGIGVRFLGIPRLLHRPALRILGDVIRESGCDLVHAHLQAAATLAPVAAGRAGVPAVCTLHHVPRPLRGRAAWRERLSVEVAGRSRALVFVSEASRRGFADRYRRRPTWRVIHNGIDLDRFRPGSDPVPEPLGIPLDAPVVTIVGAMRPLKGQETAIAAWPAVLRAVPDAHLLLVGSGEREAALRAQARASGVDSRVVFAGVRHDVPELLRASRVVVLASETEALPTTLIEAAACGRPVVATSVGGVPETVVHGRTGLLVPPGAPAHLASAVAALLCDRERAERMGRAGRNLAESRFDMHAWVRRLRDLYEEAAEPAADHGVRDVSPA